MTDNEIIKALKCCWNGECNNCPNQSNCAEISVFDSVIDLINRQKAEIERLINRVSVLAEIEKDYALKYGDDFDVSIVKKKIKSEARKEFAERLKAKSKKRVSDIYGERIYFKDIDNLLEEMESESK